MTETAEGRQGVSAQPAPVRTKLIEVALPLEAINAASAREKSIRHGHPSTLHLWWARRPLAACRAVLFAQLVDDPSAVPEEFPTEEAQEAERQRLFRIIENLVPWESSTDEACLMPARREIARSVAREAGLPAPETDDDIWRILREHAPPVLDPFCGGGSIPLEAQRLGLEAHASDLNPVAVLITKASIEIPPRFAGMPPVNPRDRNRGMGTPWKGATGLAADVRHYGEWIRGEAHRRIDHLYPKAEMPGGSQAAVIAWLWARTVECPNPACGARMPLVRSFALSTKRGKETSVDPLVNRKEKTVRFEIKQGGAPAEGTVNRNGARCIVCNTAVPFDYVRAEGRAGRMGQVLMAVVAEGRGGRNYLAPTEDQAEIAARAQPQWMPETDLPDQALGFRVQAYGMTRHADLFTSRQLVALTTFSALVREARERALEDAVEVGMLDDHVPLHDGGSAATAYADAVATYLAFVISRMADLNNSLCQWRSDPAKEHVGHLFTRQAISMIWDYAEANPLGPSAGGWDKTFPFVPKVLEDLLGAPVQGFAHQSDATSDGITMNNLLVSTDPPYYDNIGYADLSDFFYVWLRPALRSIYPDLFHTLLVPKKQELVAAPHRFDGSKKSAEAFFQSGFELACIKLRAAEDHRYPLALFYAFKQSEATGDGGITSTGWETMLSGLLRAGFSVLGTWPMRSELGNRMRNIGSNALASSIVLVCRPRPVDAAIASRREFVSALRAELPGALAHLRQGAIAPVDLPQAAIGPGMRVFSRYSKVIESDGTPMSIRAALGLINAMLYEVQAETTADFDAETRWAMSWFEQYGTSEGKFGEAETMFKAMNTSETALREARVAESHAGKVRLIRRDELPYDWDPLAAHRVTVWGVTQAMIVALDRAGEAGAAALLRRAGALSEAARDLAYALYLVAERKGWTEEGIAYNSLAASYSEMTRLAATPVAGQLGLAV